MTAARRLYQLAVIAGVAGSISAIAVLAGVIAPASGFEAAIREPRLWISSLNLALGLSVIALGLRPESRVVRQVVAAVGALLLLSVIPSLVSPILGLELGPLGAPRPLRGIAGLLGYGALFAIAIGARSLGSVLGLSASLIAFTVTLGFLYGGPLIRQGHVPQISVPAAAMTMLLGIGLSAAAGPGAFPWRYMIGDSVRAMLLRAFIPLIALIVIVTDIVTIKVFSGFSSALGSGFNTIVSVVLSAAVVWSVGGIIGRRLERATTELRQSEEKFRRVFAGVPAGISVSVLETGRFVDINEEFTRIFGFERADVLGKTSAEIGLVADSAARERLPAAQLPAGRNEVRDLQLHMRPRDGRPLIVRSNLQVLDLDGDRLLVSAFADETGRHLAEARYADLVNGVRDVVFSLAADGTITSLNPAFTHITGLRAEDWIGKPFSGLLHPGDVQRANAALETSIAGEVLTGPPYRIRSATGFVLSEMNLAPRLEDGRVVSIIGIGRDVSERERLEQELRQSQKMEAIARLTGGIAHDFNNLLTVIIGFGQMVRDATRREDPLRHEIEEVIKAGERAADLTRQLLAFSRRDVVDVQPVDVNRIVAGMERMLRRMVGTDVQIVSQADPSLGIVSMDPGQLEQVIANLVVNARDAMPAGGTVTMATSNVTLDDNAVRAHPGIAPGQYVRLSVSDTGTGMTPEVKARIFEPFFTTKEAGKGTGLGLATAFGIVRQGGGFITVQSEPGKGSRFDIHLPMTRAKPSVAVDGARQAPPQSGDETILVVDDDEAVRYFVVRALRRQGFTVLVADGPEKAAETVANPECRIDLVVSDVMMPGLSGPEMTERFVAMRPGLRVLFLSGLVGEQADHYRISSGHHAFLAKPFTPDALIRKVRDVLDATPAPLRM